MTIEIASWNKQKMQQHYTSEQQPEKKEKLREKEAKNQKRNENMRARLPVRTTVKNHSEQNYQTRLPV